MNYQNGIVSTTVLEYRNHKLGKSVSIVGIIHYGTDDYYHRISDHLQALKKETILLTEFATCSSALTSHLDFYQCDNETIQKAWNQSLFPARLNQYLKLDSETFENMKRSDFLTKVPCQLDQYSNIPRHSDIFIDDVNLGQQLLAAFLYRTDSKKECNSSSIIQKIYKNPKI